jgi:type I restriction enzyme, S subunit
MSDSSAWYRSQLRAIAAPVRRAIRIRSNVLYRTMGVRWWGKGAYERESKLGKDIKASNMFLVHESDLVVNRIWARNGSSAIAGPEVNGCVVTSDFPTYELDLNQVSVGWLSYIFQSQKFWDECNFRARGTSGRQRVSSEEYLDIEVPLPPLEEQERIVLVLDACSDRLREAEHLVSGLYSEVRALRAQVLSAIVDGHRGTYSQETLSDIVTVVGGGTPSRKNARYWSGDIPWVTPKDMKSYLISDSQERITELGLQSSAAKLIQPEAVLVVFRSSILVHSVPIAISTVPVTVNQDLKALTPIERLLPRYLALVLQAREKEILSFVKRGATVHSLHAESFWKLKIPIPPVATQIEAITADTNLTERQQMVGNDAVEIELSLSNLIPSLLDKLWSGHFNASVPDFVLQEVQARKVFEQEQLRKKIEGRGYIPVDTDEEVAVEKPKVEGPRDLTALLEQLIEERQQSINPRELWQSSGLPTIDVFYAYLKVEHLNGRIVQVRNGYDVALELNNEDTSAVD